MSVALGGVFLAAAAAALHGGAFEKGLLTRLPRARVMGEILGILCLVWSAHHGSMMLEGGGGKLQEVHMDARADHGRPCLRALGLPVLPFAGRVAGALRNGDAAWRLCPADPFPPGLLRCLLCCGDMGARAGRPAMALQRPLGTDADLSRVAAANCRSLAAGWVGAPGYALVALISSFILLKVNMWHSRSDAGTV